MASGDIRRISPWLSVWVNPHATIDDVLARHSTAPVLLLAGLNTSLAFLAVILTESHVDLSKHDWRALAAGFLGSAAVGIVFLYIAGLFFNISGRVFRGTASAADLRAVLAWGQAPKVMALAICLIILATLEVSGARPEQRTLQFVLQAVAGVFGLWSLVATLLMLGRAQKFRFWRTIGSYVFGCSFLLLAFFFRTFLLEPFDAPSGSMAPTIVVGDYFFASKYRYGYSRYSLPFSLPLIAGRTMGGEPERGDVVVYRQPKDPSIDFLKRVVGLPGDRVQVQAGVLYINGEAIPREPLGEFVDKEMVIRTRRWRETLPNGRRYEVLDNGDGHIAGIDDTQTYTVPPGRYFVMGDNRQRSVDSRFPEAQGGGLVPFENLIGRVEMIFYSPDSARIGMTVR
jgi:signal peptidase I